MIDLKNMEIAEIVHDYQFKDTFKFTFKGTVIKKR